jgi:PAS domain S-box-containing protein
VQPLSQFQSHQLEVIARVTPHAMAGHILNTTVLAFALAGSVPRPQLIAWCLYSYAIALALLYRHLRSRGRTPGNFLRVVRRATAYAFFLALPWSIMVVSYLGSLSQHEELILVALAVGMAASGTILLSAIPQAAFCYMSVILIPSAGKCLIFLNQRSYILLGVLSISYWWFLAALITKIKREIDERKQADISLKESETRLQEALAAGQVVAFTWSPATDLSERSQNAPKNLGLATHGPGKDFLARLYPDDRRPIAARIKRLCPESPFYTASFRFIRADGHEVWLEESGRAEFETTGRYVRLEGLTRDITDRKRSEERQRLLIRELDHRVKNVLASVATVAQRTREGSARMEEFLLTFDGRIQSMANAHALLSRNQWLGVSLRELVRDELAPCVREDNATIEGPDVLLSAEATQSIAIVLHELVTNASKYGALSTENGRISVRWDWLGVRERLLLEWIEAQGPPVVAPIEAGYGTRAIRNLVPYELGGSVELCFDEMGLRCRIELPSKCVCSDGPSTNPIKASESPPSPAAESLRG